MKKTVSFLLVLGCISAAVSCKKEITANQNTDVNGVLSVSEESQLVTAQTKFGVMVADPKADTDDKITISNELGVSYVRNSIILDGYNGRSPVLEDFSNAGVKVLLNLNNKSSSSGAHPFPTDMVKYKKSLANVLDSYHPEVAVIENEPANEGYYTGPIENYFTELRAAIDVCKARGIKVSDGALHIGMVLICVYQDYVSQGQQKKADDFASRSGMSSSYIKTAKGNGSADLNAKLTKCKKMIAAYKNMALDYVNFHWYEPMGDNASKNTSTSAKGVAKEVADYLRKATGKNVLTNEFGQTNKTSSLIASQVNEFRLAGLSYAIDYSNAGSGGGGIGGVALHQGITLQPNGIAYRNAIAQ
ncbi:hypothetical protein FRZ67_20185 [Panacibacter ginsenosidivorans]|uniref:Asl1-like glycosyl hydrolase catalytic domain-containing protein n=1 Tax=Panacibacter ginsenosidivorans TaxID=1813871 RepID=A0A5B8VG11_9BACT|nr:hypothetical protein [Panacibacter ginsenosidivorans]QEC69506.1 hypothetical protein FRZ67_20185 [Panacibacter ginsenosidivorans]